MIDLREASQRFVTRAEGRTTWHSFSFGAHYDPANVAFARLVAHNEEHLPAGTGHAAHAHADVEIVSWVLAGALRHTSDVGSAVIRPGQVQRLSAGRGVVHAEVAAGPDETRFLQAWLRPDEPGGEPDYVAAGVAVDEGWTCVASGDGRGVVTLGARGSAMHVAHLDPGRRLALPEAPRLHVFVAVGSVQLGERLLGPGDAARVTGEAGRAVTAKGPAQLVAWLFGDGSP